MLQHERAEDEFARLLHANRVLHQQFQAKMQRAKELLLYPQPQSVATHPQPVATPRQPATITVAAPAMPARTTFDALQAAIIRRGNAQMHGYTLAIVSSAYTATIAYIKPDYAYLWRRSAAFISIHFQVLGESAVVVVLSAEDDLRAKISSVPMVKMVEQLIFFGDSAARQ